MKTLYTPHTVKKKVIVIYSAKYQSYYTEPVSFAEISISEDRLV